MEAIIDKFMQKIVKCKYNINDDDPLVTIALQKIYNKNQLDEFTKYTNKGFFFTSVVMSGCLLTSMRLL